MDRDWVYFYRPMISMISQSNYRVKKLYEDTKIDKNELWNKYEAITKDDIDNNPRGFEVSCEENIKMYQNQMSDIADILFESEALHLKQFLSSLYKVWKNELLNYLNDERQYVEIQEPLDSFQSLENLFENNIGIDNIKGFRKIKELYLLINLLDSDNKDLAEALKTARPDYFEHNFEKFVANFDSLENWTAVYVDGSDLHIKESDFYAYFDAITDFWYSLPVVMHLDGKTPPAYD